MDSLQWTLSISSCFQVNIRLTNVFFCRGCNNAKELEDMKKLRGWMHEFTEKNPFLKF
jgi:hypothetical protein